MKVLHLASGNRWTGAAAPAFAEVEALRAAGVDAHFAYVGGYKLEAKIGHYAFAHPLIEKAQNPLSFNRTAAAIEGMAHHHRFDVIHAHLTWDHWLACFVARNHDVRLARTFHSRRVLRNDPLTRSLVRRTDHLFLSNDTFRDAALLRQRECVFTPPPIDRGQFSPDDGGDARSLLAIPSGAKLITVIGKLSKGRGFEEALRTFAVLPRSIDSRMMVIGHGEHGPALQELARSLAIADRVTWAGYHEHDLADHYRASDVLLFTARGSDEGHRAILEAMACGVPVASYPIEGVAALIPPEMIATEARPEALAATVASLLGRDLRSDVRERSQQFGYDRAAERLIGEYGGIRV